MKTHEENSSYFPFYTKGRIDTSVAKATFFGSAMPNCVNKNVWDRWIQKAEERKKTITSFITFKIQRAY